MEKKFELFLILSSVILTCLAKDPVWINPINPKDPIKLPDGTEKKVLVIGGGLAG
ncbi:unnamed protein product, partial [Brachionus calyciflorus]